MLNRHSRPVGLSRQARKVLDKLKDSTTERITKRESVCLLSGLGFILKQTGTHQHWRHPEKGVKFTYVYKNHDDGLWGYTLTDLKVALRRCGVLEEPASPPTTVIEPPKPGDTSLDEKRIFLLSNFAREIGKPVSKEEPKPMDTNTAEILKHVKQLTTYAITQNQKLDAMTELLVESCAKTEALQTELESLRATLAAVDKAPQSKFSAQYLAIQSAIERFPMLKEDAQAIAGIAKTTTAKVKKYMEGKLK